VPDGVRFEQTETASTAPAVIDPGVVARFDMSIWFTAVFSSSGLIAASRGFFGLPFEDQQAVAAVALVHPCPQAAAAFGQREVRHAACRLVGAGADAVPVAPLAARLRSRCGALDQAAFTGAGPLENLREVPVQLRVPSVTGDATAPDAYYRYNTNWSSGSIACFAIGGLTFVCGLPKPQGGRMGAFLSTSEVVAALHNSLHGTLADRGARAAARFCMKRAEIIRSDMETACARCCFGGDTSRSVSTSALAAFDSHLLGPTNEVDIFLPVHFFFVPFFLSLF
jgi:hypothetical protein